MRIEGQAMYTQNEITGNGSKEATRQATRQVTGRMVFICLVAFFAVVAGVNAVMIRFAVSTFGGLETESSYQAGLAFARETAAVAAQDALHWQVKAKVSTAAETTLVEVVANDVADRPLAGLQASAWLLHPTDRRADQEVALHESASGQFRGRSAPLVGQWALVIELSRDGTRLFRSKNRVFLR
jgi:nitrogen fixation protein FixH